MGVITASDLMLAGQTTEVKKVFACTSQLVSISLSSLLDEPNKQTAFYSNVTNLLYMHCLMAFLQWEGHDIGLRMVGGSRVTLDMIQSDRIAQMSLFMNVGYYVGELGLIRWVWSYRYKNNMIFLPLASMTYTTPSYVATFLAPPWTRTAC